MENHDIILKKLETMYPDAQCALNHRTPFELLVATILSAQCTDVRVNIITESLFREYNTPKDFAEMTYEELEPMIKSCGVYHNKSRSIINTSRILLEKYSSQVPEDMDELMSLPGVGRKTANVVMSNAFHKNAIAVDTHVFRVSNRLGLADANNVLDTEKQLMQNIPEDKWTTMHHCLIFHGRQVCSARSPRCEVCGLNEYCRYYNADANKSQAAEII
ncbi:MAG: endonuclease III [Clostridia bacterium]|nr:endonuclease III [Clostridia bacterium]